MSIQTYRHSRQHIREKRGFSLLEYPAVVYLCLFCCFEPDVVKTLPVIGNIVAYAKLFVFLICAFEYSTNRGIEKTVIYPLLYFAVYAVSALYRNQSLLFVAQKAIPCIGVWMLIQLLFHLHREKALDYIGNYLLCMLSITAILIVFYPNGLAVVYSEYTHFELHFLGAKNQLLSWLVLATVCVFAYHYLKPSRTQRNKINLLIPLLLFVALMERSSTCIVCIAAMFILLFMNLRKGSNSTYGIKAVAIVSVILVLLVVVFRVQENLDAVFVTLFGKTSDFSGRTLLWDQAFELIKQSPFIGFGLREDSLITIAGRTFTAHNFYLEALCSGGIAALAAFFLMIAIIGKRVAICRNNAVGRILIVGIFMFFLGTITEAGIYNYRWFCLFALVLCVSSIMGEKMHADEKQPVGDAELSFERGKPSGFTI